LRCDADFRRCAVVPHDVASEAVEILARLFREFPDQLSNEAARRLTDAAVKKAFVLYEVIRSRLSPGRDVVLDDVKRHPDDLAARRSLREELTALMAEEPSFLAELTGGVVQYYSQVNVEPSTTVTVTGDVSYGTGHEVRVNVDQPTNVYQIHRWPRGATPPAQFEPPPPDYVGRGAELADGARILGNREKSAPVLLVVGEPGMGKTAFAHVLANRLGRRGYRNAHHLEVRLGGEGQPEMSAEEALGYLLRELHVPDDEIESGVRARRSRYLSRWSEVLLVTGGEGSHQVK